MAFFGRVVDQRAIRRGLHFQHTVAACLALFRNHREGWIDENRNPVNQEFLDQGRFLDNVSVLHSFLLGGGRCRNRVCCPGRVLDLNDLAFLVQQNGPAIFKPGVYDLNQLARRSADDRLQLGSGGLNSSSSPARSTTTGSLCEPRCATTGGRHG